MLQNNIKIYVLGREGTGWSIDADRAYTIKALKATGYKITNNPLKANVIYAVWWAELLSKKVRLFLRVFSHKKVVAVFTSDLSHQGDEVRSIVKYVDHFVVANSKQLRTLMVEGISETRISFLPFYVDEKVYNKLNMSKEELCNILGIQYERIRDKFIIGSFQRDSLGQNLLEQKWQKNPEFMAKCIKRLNPNQYLLLLAGPRRHYIIKRCEEMGINYLYIGDSSPLENNCDDIHVNNIGIEIMPYLYNLIDLYSVSSSSEGGPKAIPEAVLSKTNVVSTDVGFACDLLLKKNIIHDEEEFLKIIGEIMSDREVNNTMIEGCYSKIKKYYSFNIYSHNIHKIILTVIS